MNFVTPAGFRDIMPAEAARREQIVRNVQELFAERGYAPIETPTLERLDVMQAGGRIPATPFKLFDAAGDLLALRPDVTMQVARMCATRLRGQDGTLKFRYTQRVFRETDTQAAARELTQIGIECIGEAGSSVDAEVVGLFVAALKAAGLRDVRIAIGTVGVLRALLEACPAPGAWKNKVLDAYHASNFTHLDRLVQQGDAPDDFAQAIGQLPRICGGMEAVDRVRELVEPLGCVAGLDALAHTLRLLERQGLASSILVDFSIMSSFDYYTGIVFEAYAPGMGVSLGSGGRYDQMLAAYDGVERPAAGFAFYLETVSSALADYDGSAPEDLAEPAAAGNGPERPLRIAVPKGSLAKDTVACLAAAGLDTTGLDDPGRQLVISNPGVDYIIVRPTDAPAFVALGAADCGICGLDSLIEAQPDVVELVDLGFGGCRFVVAQPQGATASVAARLDDLGSIRVATKYPHITRQYYERQGTQVDIVKLHGNIELAPIVGLAERIVDITATGTTLRENNLEIVDEVLSSTARFFANNCAFRTDERVGELARALRRNVDAAQDARQ